METLSKSDSPTLLSNIEVMEILSERAKARKNSEENGSSPGRKRRIQHPQLQHRDWIEENVLAYIRSTPCANVDIERMPQLVSALRGTRNKNNAEKKKSANATANDGQKGFDLTDAEILQILNFMPEESVDIHLMIEELHSRMSDERQEELLQLIASHTRQHCETNDQKPQSVKEPINGVAVTENGTADKIEPPDTQWRDSAENMSLDTIEDVVMKDEPP